MDLGGRIPAPRRDRPGVRDRAGAPGCSPCPTSLRSISAPRSAYPSSPRTAASPSPKTVRFGWVRAPSTGESSSSPAALEAVGNAAIQLARWSDATVIATVSDPRKAQLAAVAGADHVINYRQQDVISEVRKISPHGVNTIVEVAIGGECSDRRGRGRSPRLGGDLLERRRRPGSRCPYGAHGPERPVAVPCSSTPHRRRRRNRRRRHRGGDYRWGNSRRRGRRTPTAPLSTRPGGRRTRGGASRARSAGADRRRRRLIHAIGRPR